MYRNNFSYDNRMPNRRNNFVQNDGSCMNANRQNSEPTCMRSSHQNSEPSCMRSSCQEAEPICMPTCHDSDSSCMNLHDMAIAMAYVPWQHFNSMYELPMALQVGTIFPELNKPFRGSKGGMKCPCRQ